MTIYRCDKCHRDVPGQNDLSSIAVPPGHSSQPAKIVELCQRCVLELRRWLEPDPRVAKAEVA